MAEAADTGMDKAEMKKLLARSKKEPVNCALAQQKDTLLLVMDKIKQPKALLKSLEKDHPDLKNARWGSAFVDVDEDPKLVILTLNRAAPGFAAKAKKTLKGTGFSKVEIRLEDGTVAEAAGDEEEAPEQASAAAPAEAEAPETPAAAAPAMAETAEPGADDTEAPQPDLGELTRRLTELVKRMVAEAGDPSAQQQLRGLAVEAQAAVKAGDPHDAERAVDALEQALDAAGGGQAATPEQAAAEPAAAQAAPPANMAAFTKARQAWTATRKKIEDEVGKLHAQMTAHYKDHGFGSELDKYFTAKVEPILHNLDDSLASKLDEVANNPDPAQHAKLVEDAKGLIAKYQSYLSGEPLIAKLDSNPFVPLAIQKTLSATLAALGKAVH